MHTSIHPHAHTCTHMQAYICTHMNKPSCIPMHTPTCTHTHTLTCMCTHICEPHYNKDFLPPIGTRPLPPHQAHGTCPPPCPPKAHSTDHTPPGDPPLPRTGSSHVTSHEDPAPFLHRDFAQAVMPAHPPSPAGDAPSCSIHKVKPRPPTAAIRRGGGGKRIKATCDPHLKQGGHCRANSFNEFNGLHWALGPHPDPDPPSRLTLLPSTNQPSLPQTPSPASKGAALGTPSSPKSATVGVMALVSTPIWCPPREMGLVSSPSSLEHLCR